MVAAVVAAVAAVAAAVAAVAAVVEGVEANGYASKNKQNPSRGNAGLRLSVGSVAGG